VLIPYYSKLLCISFEVTYVMLRFDEKFLSGYVYMDLFPLNGEKLILGSPIASVLFYLVNFPRQVSYLGRCLT
jgi:hypothetical protein